ncbi:hypothetical protein [Streptomyces sp. NBC_01237]|nr:hypothetical protein [Streptomyces sp. NBC_01237]WRZ72579.1 hypothetical protein OG251_13575 [Streptomyces sp. NBC_01237]
MSVMTWHVSPQRAADLIGDPVTGAAYAWFPRECVDALACSGRRAAR